MREEFSNIWVHDDSRLEDLLNRKIVSREKLSHWPLSYVEKVTLSDNTRLVYKSQHAASSIENHFYSMIKMSFLLSPLYYDTYKNCDIMVMPYLDYLTLGQLSENGFEQIISDISLMIQDIPDMPVFFDLSSVEKLSSLIDSACSIFKDEDEKANIGLLKKWVSEQAHFCYDNQLIGNVHGDLTASNVLTDNGKPAYILDWQRPMKAPVTLENALAYRLAGYDAVRKYGAFGILAAICHFVWYAFACKKFIPFVYGRAQKLLQEIISAI